MRNQARVYLYSHLLVNDIATMSMLYLSDRK